MLTQLIIGGGDDTRRDHCQKYLSSESFILDGQNNSITIEQIRDFQKHLSLSPGQGSVTHFLYEAQNLTLPSQHALLKTLEEVAGNIRLILTADKTSSLIPTILSRCQIIRLDIPKQLDAQKDNEVKSLLREIVISHPAKLIDQASFINKKNPQDILINTILSLQKGLHTKPSLKRARALRLAQTCLKDLNQNLNSQLAIEHFLVELRLLML